jgi:plastocyanin
MSPRLRSIACAGTAALALLALSGAAAAADAVVKVSHSQCDPAEITVAPGTTVEFVNTVEMPGGHTLVADDGSFSSPPLMKDQTWPHIFEKPGRYAYHIKQHPNTKGVVIVK